MDKSAKKKEANTRTNEPECKKSYRHNIEKHSQPPTNRIFDERLYYFGSI